MKDTTPAFRMADRLADGRLAAVLLENESKGWSLDQIARELYAEFGVEVTRQTVMNWLRRLHAEAPADKAG